MGDAPPQDDSDPKVKGSGTGTALAQVWSYPYREPIEYGTYPV
jgi:hypothetical protein